MRQPSKYLSNYFMDKIWPSFTVGFRNINTKNTYFSDICSFADFIQKDIIQATLEDCENYLTFLSTEKAGNRSKEKVALSIATIAKKYKELSRLFSFICDNDFTTPKGFENHFSKIEITLPKEVIHPNRILSLIELDQLLAYFKDKNQAMYIAIILAYKQMLRTSELVKLRIPDLHITDTEECYLLVTSPSSEKRYTRVANDVLVMLNDYLPSLSGPFLISKNGEKPYNIRTLQKYLAEACKMLDFDKYTFNDIRNSATSSAIANGAPVEIVKNELGMKTNRHISRITSCPVKYSDASNYINIEIKH